MKRTALKRKTPLKKRRGTARRSARVRNPAYMAFVRSLPCALLTTHQCAGPIHAHHAGMRGFGQKASDDTCIPLCAFHHLAGWHDGFAQPFRSWSGGERFIWATGVVEQTREAYARRGGG